MISKKVNLLTLVFIIIGLFSIYGQEKNIVIEATVLDLETKESLPYANVIVEGTSIGTITNEDGMFDLTIEKTYAESNIVFSFMGYNKITKNLQEFKTVGDTIYMKPSSTSLSEITLVSKSKSRELIKEAIAKFTTNYPENPIYMDAYYRELTKIDKHYTKFTDAASRFYYSGYNTKYNYELSYKDYQQFDRSSKIKKVPFPEPKDFIADSRDQVKVIALRKSDNLQDYKILEQTKKLNEIQTSHLKWLENNEIGGGPLRLTGADKVKRQQDFLNPKLNEHYKFNLIGKSSYNNLPVYVIGFKPKDTLSKKAIYKGEITIDEISKAIIAYTYRPSTITKKRLNQKFAAQLKTPKSVEKQINKKFITRLTELKDYEVEVSFSQFKSKWFLKRIKVINYYKNTGDFLKNYTTTTESELIINNIELNRVHKFPEYEIYQSTFMNSIFNYKLKYTPSFWRNFNALIPTGLVGKALKDLEAESSLEEQFKNKE